MRRGQLDESVTHARQSISVEFDGTARYVEFQIDGFDEGNSAT